MLGIIRNYKEKKAKKEAKRLHEIKQQLDKQRAEHSRFIREAEIRREEQKERQLKEAGEKWKRIYAEACAKQGKQVPQWMK